MFVQYPSCCQTNKTYNKMKFPHDVGLPLMHLTQTRCPPALFLPSIFAIKAGPQKERDLKKCYTTFLFKGMCTLYGIKLSGHNLL